MPSASCESPTWLLLAASLSWPFLGSLFLLWALGTAVLAQPLGLMLPKPHGKALCGDAVGVRKVPAP